MDKEILFSIIIPVKNGDQWLDNLFNKLFQQTLITKTEIIVIDSGSTDNSLTIINNYPVKLIQIPAATFNHGETRNLGVKAAKGKYVVLTVQDAVPASDLWLQYLLDGFVSEDIAAVCGQQIVPHDNDKNPVLWFRFFSEPQITFRYFKNPADFLKLSPQDQRNIAGWDNVNAAYNREILLLNPFAKIDFAEDMNWAKEMLLQKYTLAFVDKARVFHYHHHKAEFILPRYFSVFYFEYKIFKLKPSQSNILKSGLSNFKTLVNMQAISLKEKYNWLLFNIRYRIELNKTILLFNNTLEKGEDFLDNQYKIICKKMPQAPKY